MAREGPSKRIRKPLEALAGRFARADERPAPALGPGEPPAGDLDALRSELAALRRADEELAKAVHGLSGAALAVDLASLREEVRALRSAEEGAAAAARDFPLEQVDKELTSLKEELAALRFTQQGTARGVRDEGASLRQAQQDSSQALAERLAALAAEQEATARALRDELAALRRDLEGAADAVHGLRGLTASNAERDGRWPERLSALRASREWRWAYSEREPLVTVRIATYNRAATLIDRAIASVLRQSYERWEIVVVGDGCTDDTAERIAALGHPRIRYRNLQSHGPYPDEPRQRALVAGVAAMNAGANMAEGTWIAALGDDDEWTDDHLEVLVAAALEQQAEVAYGRLVARLDEPPLETPVGAWPPSPGEFSWQAAIHNTALREFGYDIAARFVGEPAEWNLARRLWEAGVSFRFVDRVVGAQNVETADDWTVEWFRARGAGSAANPVSSP